MWGRRRGPRDGERSAERGVRVGGTELAEDGCAGLPRRGTWIFIARVLDAELA